MAKVIGEGTIVQLEKDKPKSKCRKWQLRVPVGLDPRTGKYRTRTRRVNDMTYTQAKKALRDFIEEIEDDRVWKRTGTTFEECAADFMERRDLSGEFSQNTQLRYRRCFKAVSRHIGKAEVALITPEMIEGMYAAMRQGDTLSGKPSSGAYLNQINKTLDLMFRDLVEREVIVRNPIDKVATPKVDTKEKRALTPARMRQLVDRHEVESSCDIGSFLAITRGLRRGEIGALSWRDRDGKLLGLDGWCLHELRHSYLSMLAQQGVHPKVMQELAGHASATITMDIYTHVNMDQKREAADVMEDAFQGIGAEEEFMAKRAEDAPKGRPYKVRHVRPSRRTRAPEQAPVQTEERFVPDSYQQPERPKFQVITTAPDLRVSEAI